MRAKLFYTFCMKGQLMSFLLLVFFCAAGIATEYYVVNVTSSYYMWQPVKELEGQWYFYADGANSNKGVQLYLQRYHGAIPVIEFRKQNSYVIDRDDIGYDDYYAHGVFCQVSEETIRSIYMKHMEADSFVPVSAILSQEYDISRLVGIKGVIIISSLWCLAIGFGILWFRDCWARIGQEKMYLAYIGNDTKMFRRIYCNPIFLLIPLVCIVSSVAVWIPEDGGIGLYASNGFRQITYPVVIGMFLVVTLLTRFLFGRCRKIVEREEVEQMSREVQGTLHIYIDDYTISENLQLVLLARGFSRSVAVTLAGAAMRERRMEYCAKRLMSMCPWEEKANFFQIQEQFMEEISYQF